MIKEIGSLYFINTDFNVDWFKFVIIVNRIPRFDASLILNKITWVRWVLYAVSLFLPLFIIYSMVRPPDKTIVM